MTDDTTPKKTPLHDRHAAAGAKLVDFAGWEMPVQYSGVIEEHRAVRNAAGLFDVSHMGEVRVSGPGAEAFLQLLTPNDVSRLTPGRAHYNALLTERGTYIDDLLIYRLDAQEYMVVVNAANAAKDHDWIRRHAADHEGVEVEDVSERTALIALQGPKAVAILEPLASIDSEEPLADAVRFYRCARGTVDGAQAILSRTGYTGEDGFELYLDPGDAPRVWDRLLEAGAGHGLLPAGLGARDTLRLEAGLALYGHEIDDSVTPWEAGLGWTVKLEAGDFVGREALIRQKESGVERKLIGFEVEGRGIAREGHRVLDGDEPVGHVASGTWSPTFEKALGTCFVPTELAEPDGRVVLEVRKRRLDARLVKLPFYKRS
ncbi:MAG: glycine cleavage system aminomethyltransferase GcvT [Acidobacteriota bacterium]|jgi:aminomethyltransferase